MKTLLTLAITALLLQPTSVFAEHGDGEHIHKSPAIDKSAWKNVAVKPNEAVFEVHGIVCSFCSVGVQKKLSKLSFIDISKYTKGVHVDIEKQKVTVAIKPDTKLDVKAAYDSIKSGGYEPVKVMVADAYGKITTYNDNAESE